MNEIIIYQDSDQTTQVEVRFEGETVWLNQEQMALLFQRDQSVISRHVRNIFKEGELEPESNMQKMHIAHSDKPVVYYNLDMIISVGYRVNSKRGTHFRQWATKRLKDYLVEGYAINQKRLEERRLEIKHLKEGISILHRAIDKQAQTLGDARDLAKLLEQFSAGLLLLDDYDHETLDTKGKTSRKTVSIGKDQYLTLIDAMRNEFSSEQSSRYAEFLSRVLRQALLEETVPEHSWILCNRIIELLSESPWHPPVCGGLGSCISRISRHMSC